MVEVEVGRVADAFHEGDDLLTTTHDACWASLLGSLPARLVTIVRVKPAMLGLDFLGLVLVDLTLSCRHLLPSFGCTL